MPLSPSDQLGPYVILAPIGAGGMGEVYKARDTRLDRIIAIKLSKNEFSERFGQLYDLGTLPEVGGYLVMEYIDGSPIASVDSPRKLLDLAVQIASAPPNPTPRKPWWPPLIRGRCWGRWPR